VVACLGALAQQCRELECFPDSACFHMNVHLLTVAHTPAERRTDWLVIDSHLTRDRAGSLLGENCEYYGVAALALVCPGML
jgi:hypothetical protein